MKATELIGKRAIRTNCATLSYGIDRSYTDTPIRILKATDSHIIYQYDKEFDPVFDPIKFHIMSYAFCDDNWTDFDELIKGINVDRELLK
jgi:hypothetical protein